MTDPRVGALLRLARALPDAMTAAAIAQGLSPAMAREVTRITLARYTPDAVTSLRTDALAGRRVQLRLARSVPTAPLRAMALPWLAGAARVTVRAPESHRALTERIATTLGLDLGDDPDADHVIAYGSDEAVARIRDALRPGVGFEGHGHGLGVAVVGDGADAHAAGEAIARDVALYDQRGCLSPQAVLVRGDGHAVAEALHTALTGYDTSLPRGALDAGEGARVMQWQGVQSALCARVWRGAGHFVALSDGAVAVGAPGGRSVVVMPLASAEAVRAALAPVAGWITTVGLAGAWPEAARPVGLRGRVVPAGAMQDPPLDGPEDPR